MYGDGKGVPQDYVTAHMWINLASANGNEIDADRRNWFAMWMGPNQIAEAQRRARVCMASDYKDCD